MALGNDFTDAVPTDGIAGISTRRSMQARRSSIEGFRSPFLTSNGSARNSTSDRRALMQDYDVENQFELGDLAEDSDENGDRKRTSFDGARTSTNGRPSTGGIRVKKETIRTKTMDR